jgi:hypothetical protein
MPPSPTGPSLPALAMTDKGYWGDEIASFSQKLATAFGQHFMGRDTKSLQGTD